MPRGVYDRTNRRERGVPIYEHLLAELGEDNGLYDEDDDDENDALLSIIL
jgi:hypothetical protein